MKQAGKNKRVSTPRLPKLKPRPIVFFYEDFGGEIRWWCNQNAGDQFDIIDREELEKRIYGAELCHVRVVDHLPGFCELRDECPDHLGYY